MTPQLNLIGYPPFGALKVIGRAPSRHSKTYWLCKCKCGREIAISGSKLLRGLAVTCGQVGCRKGLPRGTLLAITPEESKLLGTDTDSRIAKRLGKTPHSIGELRRRLGIERYRPSKKCLHCKKQFVPSRYSEGLCSDACRAAREAEKATKDQRRLRMRKQIQIATIILKGKA